MGAWLALALVACGPGAAPDAADMERQMAAADDDFRRLELLEVNTTRHPDDPGAWLWLARAYRKRDDPRAKATYERAIAVDPVGDIPRIELAWLEVEPAMRRGLDPTPEQLAFADGHLAEAVSRQPTCFNKGQRLAMLELSAEKVAPSADTLAFAREAALACAADATLGPPLAVSYGRLARAGGDLEAARTWICTGFDGGQLGAAADCLALTTRDPATFTPSDARGHLLLADVARGKRDAAAERTHLDAALAGGATGWFVHERLADLAHREGRNVDACAAIATARAAVPAVDGAAPAPAVEGAVAPLAPLAAVLSQRAAEWRCPG